MLKDACGTDVSHIYPLAPSPLPLSIFSSLPRHSPRSGAPPGTRWQCRPLMWSQGCRRLHSWLNCLAHTLQQPQPSVIQLMPGGQEGGECGHEHCDGQPPSTCSARQQEGRSGMMREAGMRAHWGSGTKGFFLSLRGEDQCKCMLDSCIL